MTSSLVNLFQGLTTVTVKDFFQYLTASPLSQLKAISSGLLTAGTAEEISLTTPSFQKDGESNEVPPEPPLLEVKQISFLKHLHFLPTCLLSESRTLFLLLSTLA